MSKLVTLSLLTVLAVLVTYNAFLQEDRGGGGAGAVTRLLSIMVEEDEHDQLTEEKKDETWLGTIRRRLRRRRPYLDGYRRTPRRDIVETAQRSGLTGLVNLVQIAGLTETLKGDGPFTVFAPSDRAFGKFAAEYPQLLETLKGDTALLSNVLLYHVVPGMELRTFGRTWRGGGPFTTAFNDTTVETKRYRGGRTGPLVAKVNDARVVVSNVITSNGVVHVIDEVLIPDLDGSSSSTPAPTTAAPGSPTTAPGITTLSPGTTAAPGATTPAPTAGGGAATNTTARALTRTKRAWE